MVHSADIQTKSSGKCMSIIQKADATPDSKMKSMPVPVGRLSRPERPRDRLAGVCAISAGNLVSPMITAGTLGSGAGVGVGLGVGVSGTRVEVGVGTGVSGTRVGVGLGVGASAPAPGDGDGVAAEV